MFDLIILVPLLPLFGFLIIGTTSKFIKKELFSGILGSGTVGLSFLITLFLMIKFAGHGSHEPIVVKFFDWFSAGNFSISVSYQIDQLSLLFGMIVTGVGFLIHVYSIGYMHGDRSYARFFAYLNLFIFMMLNLVLSSNFLLTFLGWEGVGLCSYLLIGFWYDRKFEGTRIIWTGDAANKAFIVNRIGDFGFIIAMFLMYSLFHNLEYNSISGQSANMAESSTITAITLLLFLGCTGKSAQIPLAVWLPDAMAGPTPVSALIHAATMVTAGIFLIARNSALFALAPYTMNVIAIVGVLTAFFAATIGVVQNDIKKVLAYSTVSQLGFMFAALGVGAFTAGVFHVMTHAFFKGLLFLGAGSVIHGMHEEQNIKNMGGLKNYMPWTYKTFFVATLAIAGIPFFSGFFSKDEILWMTFSQGNWALWLILAMSALMTAFYMFRLLYLTFYGNERFDKKHVHPHESPKTMTVPLIILAVLSAFGGFLGVPKALYLPNVIESWLEPVFETANGIIANRSHTILTHQVHAEEYILMLVSIGIALAGIFLARSFYLKAGLAKPKAIAAHFSSLYKMLFNKYKLDEFYYAVIIDPIFKLSQNFFWKVFDVRLIDGIVNGSAKVTLRAGDSIRKIQTGIVQNYALLMFLGIILILSYLLIS
ncbi:MAG: dehydrogenase [Ignavibacteria bacterium]|nr:dehydrogenase [Ignavibacteria bacterium]